MGRGARGVSFDGGKLAGKISETAHIPFHLVSFVTIEFYFWFFPCKIAEEPRGVFGGICHDGMMQSKL